MKERHIPGGLLPLVFLQGAPRDLFSFALVCKQWNEVLAQDDRFWQLKFRRDFSLGNVTVTPKSSWRNEYIEEWGWRRGSFQCTNLVKEKDPVNCFDVEGSLLASWHLPSCQIKIWDTETQKCVRVIDDDLCDHRPPQFVKLKGRHVLKGSYKKGEFSFGYVRIKCWEVGTGVCVKDFLQGMESLGSIACNRVWLVCSEKNGLFCWDLQTWTRKVYHIRNLRSKGTIALKGDVCVVVRSDGRLTVWNLRAGLCVRELDGPGYEMPFIDFYGNSIAVGDMCEDTCIQIWETETGRCKEILHGHQDVVSFVAYDGVRVVSVSVDGAVKVWEASTGRCVRTLSVHSMVEFAVLGKNELFCLTWGCVKQVSLGPRRTGRTVWDMCKIM